MTTLGELKARILRLVGDPTGANYAEELLLDGISAAFDAILPWAPKTAFISLASGSTAYDLPADLYQIESCVDKTTGEVFSRTMFRPGILVGEDSRLSNSWHDIPNGKITFARQLANSTDLNYLAHWTKPLTTTEDETVMEPPERVAFGICLHATATILVPASLNTSELRQFATKVDSGNPEHNPLQESITYLHQLFKQEMNRFPAYQRAQQ